MSVPRYYSDLTEHYLRYGGLRGFHYGIWENGVRSHAEALDRSNELLVRDLALDRESRVLDVGCGIGSFAIWCAEHLGCRVTGVNTCAAHVAMAMQLAEERGVADRCEFLTMDMRALDFATGSFALIVNQESFCYAPDERAYLARVRELLAPGGVWSAIAFSLRDDPLTTAEERAYQQVRDGFHLPGLLSGRAVGATLAELGYAEVEVRDLTPLVAPTARHIIRHCYAPLALIRLHLDGLFFRDGEASRRNHQGHFKAGMAYSRGLLRGTFRQNLFRARR